MGKREGEGLVPSSEFLVPVVWGSAVFVHLALAGQPCRQPWLLLVRRVF